MTKSKNDWFTIEKVRHFLIEEPCNFPEDFDINNYQLFKGMTTRILKFD